MAARLHVAETPYGRPHCGTREHAHVVSPVTFADLRTVAAFTVCERCAAAADADVAPAETLFALR